MWLWMVKNFKAFWLVHCEIGNGIADVIGSLCGCYLLYLVSVYIDNKFHPLSRFLSFFGNTVSSSLACIYLKQYFSLMGNYILFFQNTYL